MTEVFVPQLPTSRRPLRLMDLSISKKIAAIFAVVLLVATTNVLVVRTMLSDLNGVAETVNVAGKLRMLTQKIAFETTRMVHESDPEPRRTAQALADFESGLVALERGGQAFGYQINALSGRHQHLLQTARRDWVDFRGHIESIFTSGASSAESRHALNHMAEDATRQLNDAENLVRELTLETQYTQTRTLNQLYGLLLLDVVVLLLVFQASRRQLVEPLRVLARRSRELAEGNFHARIDHPARDEIGQLADSFNDAALRIGTLIANINQDRQNLKQAESMFRGLAENSVVGVYIVQDARFQYVNAKMAAMFDYSLPEMMNSVSVLDLVTDQERGQVEENRLRRLRGEVREVNYERKARRKDGSTFDVEVFGAAMPINGRPATIGIMLDITERKRLTQSLRVLSACNRALARATDETALLNEVCQIICQEHGHPLAWIGYAEDDGARRVRPVAVVESRSDVLQTLIQNVFWDEAESGCGPTGGAVRDGQIRVMRDLLGHCEHPSCRQTMHAHGVASAIALPLTSGSKVIGALTIYAEAADMFNADEVRVAQELANNLSFGITALRTEASRRNYAQALEHQAHHDALTGLPNRLLMKDRLRQAIGFAVRYSRPVWVLFLDLDHFKFVNDSLGHTAGDQLLKAIAGRLQSVTRETDTVARLGGDEFVLILPERVDTSLSSQIVQRIRDAVAQPITIEGLEFTLSASIGVATYPIDGDTPELLIKHADMAMYRAKEIGRNNFQFFTASMNARMTERLQIESDLRNALERNEFVLHYQPQVEAHSGRIIGMEALIRWQHPTLGLVAPLRFIGLAEETGLIVPIGAWVLRTACAQNKAWQQAGLGPLRVAVNFSARQFSQENLVQSIAAVLEDTGLSAQYLDIELTESLVMTDIEHAIGLLHQLKALGVQLSLDDFGTGHSSLSYLKRLPLDVLKIDQSFVRDIAHAPNDAAIVASIIALAHNLQLSVIAEGVETAEQLAFLQRNRCNEMQGYYFSKPVPAAAFEQVLKTSGDGWPVAD